MSLAADAALDALARVLDESRRVIDGVRSDQIHLPTPCQSWDVSTVINHVVRDARQFTEMARGASWAPGELNLAADEWPDAFRAGGDALLATWRDRDALDDADLNRVNQQIAEFAVHIWDIAKATGQPVQLGDDTALRALAWAQRSLKPEHRGDEASGKVFGPEVAIAETASPLDRLAAFFGRTP
jgi:uncharacterized protein (TIGR03086 family)